MPKWNIKLIAARLEDVFERWCNRLIINVPPRSLKSVMASVAFVAWALGRNPSLQIICASYGQDLADKLAQDTRSIMQSDWYRRVFGRVLRRQPAGRSRLPNHGRVRAHCHLDWWGAHLTRADLIVMDDSLKPDGAMPDAERAKANAWFDQKT